MREIGSRATNLGTVLLKSLLAAYAVLEALLDTHLASSHHRSAEHVRIDLGIAAHAGQYVVGEETKGRLEHPVLFSSVDDSQIARTEDDGLVIARFGEALLGESFGFGICRCVVSHSDTVQQGDPGVGIHMHSHKKGELALAPSDWRGEGGSVSAQCSASGVEVKEW